MHEVGEHNKQETHSVSEQVNEAHTIVGNTAGFQPALVAAAKKGMKPVLVNVNSFGGRIPLRSMPAYTSSKYALAGFTDAIRPDFADQGIHVAQVHPGISINAPA